MKSFEVYNYSKSNLEYVFKDAQFPDRPIQNKGHILYLKNYFSIVKPQTILLEKEYIDKDYLEDYSFYYVKSFHNYDRFCKRVHFFDSSFTDNDLQLFLQGNPGIVNNELLITSYIGFIVIKPLPQTYIGRSCLKTYPTDGTRLFPPVKQFKSHVFGIELSVDSIPYQEQDSVVAACASIALWSCFQSTGYKFHHYIPSPVEITKCASEYFPFMPRHFPNHGLTFEQIALCFRNYNLEPLILSVPDERGLKYVVNSYIRAQLPIIMGIELYTEDDQRVGLHAVTILGINVNEPQPPLNILATGIDKIYVHDDQVGPFARMEFMGNNLLSTSWGDNYKAKPRFLAIPLTSKIRIDFIQVKLICVDLAMLFKSISQIWREDSDLDESTSFDYFLSSINEVKQFVLGAQGIEPHIKSTFLQNNHPKHIWRIVIANQDKWLEIGLDATDIDQGDLFVYSISNSRLFENHITRCYLLSSSKLQLIKNESSHTNDILHKIIQEYDKH